MVDSVKPIEEFSLHGRYGIKTDLRNRIFSIRYNETSIARTRKESSIHLVLVLSRAFTNPSRTVELIKNRKGTQGDAFITIIEEYILNTFSLCTCTSHLFDINKFVRISTDFTHVLFNCAKL